MTETTSPSDFFIFLFLSRKPKKNICPFLPMESGFFSYLENFLKFFVKYMGEIRYY